LTKPLRRHIGTGASPNYRLTHVILAKEEAKLRRIKVQSQPGKIVHETLSQKNPLQKIGGKGLVEWLKM
jgi:hypothetical protein